MKRVAVFAICLLISGCAMKPPPGRMALGGVEAASLNNLAGPSCGARIYVAMGTNHKFPTNPGLRIPEGELYLDGQLVDHVSSNPEISVIDVPTGKVELSWMVSAYGAFDRSKTKQNRLLLDLTEREVAFVVLDYYDDTPAAAGLLGPIGILATVGFRTEVAETRDMTQFNGKRAVFHRGLQAPCRTAEAPAIRTNAASTTASSERAFRYTANATQGVPAFTSPRAEGVPVYTFTNGQALTVLDKGTDGWLRVLVPDGRTAFVPEAIVKAE